MHAEVVCSRLKTLSTVSQETDDFEIRQMVDFATRQISTS